MLFSTALASFDLQDPLTIGKIFGLVLWSSLLLIGIFKCVSIMKRPQTSSLCVSALMVFLISWLLGNIINPVAEWGGWPDWANMLAGLLLMLMSVVSIILAVSGLVVMGSQKGRYNQGKKQAIWALVLSTGMILIGVGSLLYAATANKRDDGGMARFQVKEQKEFPAWNFRFGQPSGPWRSVPIKQYMPDGLFLYTAPTPERFLSCTVEENAGMTKEGLAEFAGERVKSMSREFTQISRTVEKKGGLNFIRVKSKVTGIQGKNITLYYDSYYGCTEKVAYQFVFWTVLPSEKHGEEVESWMDSFALLEPVAEVKDPGVLVDGEVPVEGYASTLASAGWKQGAESNFPEAQVIGIKGQNSLALVTVPLPEGVTVRAADLDKRLLETMAVEETNQLKGPQPLTHHEMPGRAYTFTRKEKQQTIQFEVRILQHATRAWMLVTWGVGKPEERETAAQQVRFFPPQPGEPVKLKDATVRTRAMIVNDLGIQCYRRQDFPRALQLFELARQWAPEDAAMAGNVIDSLQQMGKQDAALEAVTGMMAKGPLAELPVMRARLAQAQATKGDLKQAAATWEQVFDEDYANEDHLLEWINVLINLEEKDKALQVVDAYGKKHPSPRVTRWQASVLGRNDRWDEAFARLAPALEGSEPDLESLYLAGELENEAGRYEASEKTARRLMAAGEETARSYMILGWSEWNRKRWKAAHEAFEKAAVKAPEAPAVKEALAMSAGMMGQGTAEVSRTPLDPVPLPAGVREAIAAQPAPPESLVQGHGAILQERHMGCYYESGKPVRVSQYFKIKVLDTAGVEAFSTLTLSFYPASETIHVNSLTVRDESGKVVQEGTTADAYTRPESGDLVTGEHLLSLPVPGLRRGCTIEAVITVQDKAKSTKAPFRRDLIASGYPALARAWFFTGDINAWKFEVSPGMTEIRGKNSLAYVAFQRRAYRNEGFMPPAADWQPWGMAGPSGEEWSTLAKDYLKRIADRLEPDDSTEAVWAKLKKGANSPDDILGAIVRYVQSSLTYKGLEFGTRAQVPSPVKKIQQDQYGDCKDHTMLLYHLLRRAGIQCHPVLVDTGWSLREKLPSLDQFNHMILYVPGFRQPWLDATTEWLDLTSTAPEYLAGRKVLVLDPQRPRLETIGAAAPGEVKIDRMMSPEGEVDARVEETLTLTGITAAWAREWLLNYPPSEHAGLIRRQLDSQGNFSLTSVELSQAEDRSKPLILKMIYNLPGALNPALQQVKVPMFWESDYLSVLPVDDRQSPFRLNPAMKFESVTRFGGAWSKVAPLPEIAGEGKAIGTTWKMAWQEEAKGPAGWKLEVSVPMGQHPAADWTTFQQTRRDLLERMKRVEVKRM